MKKSPSELKTPNLFSNAEFSTFLADNPKLISYLIGRYNLAAHLPQYDYEDLLSVIKYVLWDCYVLAKKKDFKYKFTTFFYLRWLNITRKMRNEAMEAAALSDFQIKDKRDWFAAIDNKDLAENLLDRLPERYRQIIRWRFYDKLTLAECGTALGCSSEYVRQQERVALEKLRYFAGNTTMGFRDLLPEEGAFPANS